MKDLQTDILIIGAGMTGLIAANALSELDKEITIIDRSNFNLGFKNLDLRTTAISEGTRKFFEEIGIWKDLYKLVEPIKYIKVLDRTDKRKISFNNKEPRKFLGYIIRNSILKNILVKKLKLKKNIKLINSGNLLSLNYNQNFINSFFDKYKISSKLILAADGKKSTVRNILKTPFYSKNYNHSALVINFHHTLDHQNIAYELFYKSGPLAILPMKKIKKNLFSSSVIWSNKKKYSLSLKTIEINLLKLILEEKINKYVGSIEKIVDVQLFDLSAHINSRLYEDRLIYVGDSAHSLHPIAGQGWNLGVRDIKNCRITLMECERKGLDIGSPYLCKKYHNTCYKDIFNLYQVTDKLNSIFISDSLISNEFRSIGFNLIEKNNKLKNFITNYAMGV